MPGSCWRLLRVVSPLIVASLLGGCGGGSGAKPTFGGWQSTVQDHVNTRGGGDINSLRNSDSDSARKVYSVIGDEKAEHSSDVNGLLLGRRTIAGREWYVFIVGFVKAGDVQDIRIAAATDGNGDLQWRFSPEDPAAVQNYRTAKRLARNRGQGVPVAFPLEEDDLLVEASGEIISISEKGSGVRWSLDLNARR
jgi:hypothetical protein